MRHITVLSFVCALGALTLMLGAGPLSSAQRALHADAVACDGAGKVCEEDGECDHWDVNGDCTHYQTYQYYYPAAT
ncbi:MAG TPA: hypothetical protein VHB25_08075 [Gemmatimonadaceae bacterium]|nr:hypothetical protein [Gemmatimonadaceae bacterium]